MCSGSTHVISELNVALGCAAGHETMWRLSWTRNRDRRVVRREVPSEEQRELASWEKGEEQ